MKIMLVRHGQGDEKHLTRLGRNQAKNVVSDLEYEDITQIYSSPIPRAFQTAQIIAKKLHIPVIVDDRLTEREKLSPDMTEEEQILYNENYLNPNFSMKNPEGCKEYIERIYSFLDEKIKKSNAEDNILIVGHSSMSYILASYFFGIKKNKPLVWTRLGNCSKLCFEYNKKS